MQNVFKKKFLITLLASLLAIVFAFTLSSCGKKKNNESQSEAESVEPPKPKLEATVSDDYVYTFGSFDDIYDAVTVTIVENGVSRNVDFDVVSTEITGDGNYIYVTVSAEGLRKTLRLPYKEMRGELKPLYELLSTGGDKSLDVSLAFEVNGTNEETEAVRLDIIANSLENGDAEFAVISKKGEKTTVLAVAKNGSLSVCGTEADEEIMNTLLPLVTSLFGEEDGDEAAKAPSLANRFLELSDKLDEFDSLVNGIKSVVTAVARDGVYTFSMTAEQLVAVSDLYLVFSGNEDLAALAKVIDSYAKNIDLKNTTINLVFKVNDNGFGVTFDIQSDSGKVLSCEAKAEFSDGAAALPDASENFLPEIEIEGEEQGEGETTSADIKISIPFHFPYSDANVTFDSVVRLSNIFGGEGKDLFTVSVIYNDDTVAAFVLNDEYVFADINELTELVNGEAPEYNAAFHSAFEINGEPTSFKEIASAILSGNFDALINYGDDDGYTDEPQMDYGYYTTDGEDLIFNIGATEEDLRARLFVYYSDEDGNEVEYTDYTIEGFDSTCSQVIEITIYCTENSTIGTDVTICDLENAYISESSAYDALFAKGTTVAEAKGEIWGSITYTDGEVEWYVDAEDFTVTAVNGNAVDENYAFNAGTYVLTVYNETTNEEYYIEAYVYDPENPIVTGVHSCYGAIFVYENYTEADVRNEMCIVVTYDNCGEEEVFDYEIIGGFTYGVESIRVKWRDLVCEEEIEIVYAQDEQYPDDEPYNPEEPASAFNLLDLTKYMRFLDASEDGDTATTAIRALIAIGDIVNDNKDLFDAIFTVEDGKTLKIAVNAEDDKDVFAAIGLLFGVPSEDGFDDITEEDILNGISAWSEAQFGAILGGISENANGVSLVDFFSDLYVSVTFTSDEGLSFEFVYENCDGEEYFSNEITFTLIGAADDFEIGETEDTMPINYISLYALSLLSKIGG